jgi:hypothetical protein
MKFFALMIGLCGVGLLPAAEIRWTARGTVSSITGGAFSGTGVVTGSAVEIVLVYDSQTEVNGRSYLPIGGSLAGRAWFYGAAKLGITVKIGGNTWSGEMPNIPAQVDVMESVCWDFGGNPDLFYVTLDAARGGIFPSFPHAGNETIRALKLEFRDETSPAELFNVHVLPDSLTQVCAMTSATGAIQAGASTLAFTLNPATVNVTLPRVPVALNQTATGIELIWQTETGKSYRIEGTSDLRCWSDEGIHLGTGALERQSLTPFATYPKRFYRIVEL